MLSKLCDQDAGNGLGSADYCSIVKKILMSGLQHRFHKDLSTVDATKFIEDIQSGVAGRPVDTPDWTAHLLIAYIYG